LKRIFANFKGKIFNLAFSYGLMFEINKNYNMFSKFFVYQTYCQEGFSANICQMVEIKTKIDVLFDSLHT